MSGFSRIFSRIPFTIKLASINLLALVLQVISITIFPLDFDEGVNFLIAHFIEEGYQPYTEIFASRLPLFVVILSLIWSITGGNIFLSRLMFIGLNTILLFCLGYLGRKLLGEKESLLGVTLLAASAPYISASLAIMADMLSVTFCTVSVFLVLVYAENARRIWLVLAGFFFAVGVLTSLLVLFVALVLLIILLTQHSSIPRWENKPIALYPSWKAFILNVVLLSATCLSVFIIITFAIQWQTVYESTVGYKLALRQAIPYDIRNNLHELLQFFTDNSLLFLGMLLGLLFAEERPKHVVWFLFTWWLIALFWLMIQIPLREQHLAPLWAPMALMASWGFLQLSNWLASLAKSDWENSPFARIGMGHALSLLLVFYALFNFYQVPGLLNRARNIRDEEDLRQFQAAPQAIKFLQEITLPNDCVISDNPAFSSQANRFPPPILSEPSDARIASGDLSLDLIEAVAAEHNCKALVATSHRFKKDIPGMRMWAEGFFSHYVNFEGTRIYYQGP